MNRDQRYRAAARLALAEDRIGMSDLSIENVAAVQAVNITGPASLGDGAFVELKVWIPAAAAAEIDEATGERRTA